MAAHLGRDNLGAYVISMTKGASDVMAVELLQREARMQVGAEAGGRGGGGPEDGGSLRVVPLFETLEVRRRGGEGGEGGAGGLQVCLQ